MLTLEEDLVAFLIRQIGPYVERNPKTGRPRLIRELNEVWLGIDAFGGISEAARHFNVNEGTIEDWIDNHYVPELHASVIREKLGLSNDRFILYPTTGYLHEATGFYWPWSWGLSCAEIPSV